MYKFHELKILSEFQCTADKCPQTCCSSVWTIPVDSDTEAKWNSIEQTDLKQRLLSSMKGKDKLLECVDDQCTHINGEGLCQIQLTLGHEYLPQACRSYPRLHLKGMHFESSSAQLTCPEIVRLVIDSKYTSFYKETQGSDISPIQDIEPILMDINKLLFDYYTKLMDQPNIELGVLLYDITYILDYLMQAAQKETFELNRLEKKCGKSKKIISKRIVAIENDIRSKKLRPDTAMDIKYWQLILDLLKQQKIPEFDETLSTAVSKKFISKQGNLSHSFPKRIQTIYRKLNNDFKLNQKLINLIQVKFNNHGFPWRPYKGNYTATFLDVVIPLSIMILLVCMLAEVEEEINDEVLQRIVYKVERKFTHNMSIFELLQKQPELMDLAAYNKCFIRLVYK